MRRATTFMSVLVAVAFLPASATIINIPDDYPTIQQGIIASTMIRYSLPEAGHFVIEIYDLLGLKVEMLVAAKKPAGTHSVVREAKNVPSGVYFYRVEAGKYFQTRKCVLLK